MKNKKLIVIFIFIIIFLSGCSSNVNIIVNTDDSVTESNYVYDTNSRADPSGLTKDEYINNYLEFVRVPDLDKYDKKRIYNENDFGIKYTKKYKNVCDLLNNSPFSSYFTEKKCIKNNDTYEIIAKRENAICKDCEFDINNDIQNVVINIELPDNAIENDATKVNSTIYTWEFTDSNAASLHLKFKRNNKTLVNNINFNNDNLRLPLIVLIGLIILLFILVRRSRSN